MFSNSMKTSGGDRAGDHSGTPDFALRTTEDYYGGDFVEDGSFLVLNTDGLSLSPTTPPEDRSDEDERNMDIEVLNGAEEEESAANLSVACKTSLPGQVLGEDPESSVESGHSGVKTDSQKTMSMEVFDNETLPTNSMINASLVSASSGSTDTHLNESSEEMSILMAENKKLAALLADSNEKMKQCITATEKLKADHEEYKKKHETSRDTIVQLRQDNEMLKSQMCMVQSMTDVADLPQNLEAELTAKVETIKRQNHTISELTEQMQTVLTANTQRNDELAASKKACDEMKLELERLRANYAESLKKIEVMKAEVDTGRQTITKFNEHRHRNDTTLATMHSELTAATEKIQRLESLVEEKTKLTESLRCNMEVTVTALENCNQKLNQKEEEISLLTTQIAAFRAESEHAERLQVLEVQCQTYLSDFEKEREERGKLAAEKDALLNQLNLVNQQLKLKSDAFDNLRRQHEGREPNQDDEASGSRNISATVNSNEPPQSPLTSLPSVAGHLVGFVRRELLGWEDQVGGSDVAHGATGGIGSAETVVQQPKQESIPPCPLCRKVFPTLEKLQLHASNCGIETYGDRSDPFVFP